jgi:GH35 family endo-1,4-beta-xylanase
MTFWGLTDENSWLSTEEWGPKKGRGPHLPLLFDESYRKKPAHDGVVRALAGR